MLAGKENKCDILTTRGGPKSLPNRRAMLIRVFHRSCKRIPIKNESLVQIPRIFLVSNVIINGVVVVMLLAVQCLAPNNYVFHDMWLLK